MDRRHLLALAAVGLIAPGRVLAAAAPAREPPPGYLPRAVAPPPRGLAPGMTVSEFTPTGKVWRVRLAPGDELMSGLTDFGIRRGIRTAAVSGLGGFISAELSAYDDKSEFFKKISVHEKCEIADLVGLITLGNDGRTTFHAHVVLAMLDGRGVAGHLNSGIVSPVADLIVTDLGEGRSETPR
jgi:predicted DNA-binding protein with PD1-like motif